ALGFDQALRLAKDQRATLCLLHVVDERVITQSLEGSAAGIDRLFESLRASGKEILARAESSALKRRVRVKTVLVENLARSVADMVMEQAKKWRADLIVMGTQGRRGVTRLLMGSDAEGVVRGAAVPVLLVRAKGRRGAA